MGEKIVSNSKFIQGCDTIRWAGHFFWLQSPDRIFPLAKEGDGKSNAILPFSVKATIFMKETNQTEESWCKYLKVAHWHGICCKRLLAQYVRLSNMEKSQCLEYARVETEDNGLFKSFKPTFWAVITDHYSLFHVMLMFYDYQIKTFVCLVPVKKELFTQLVYVHLHSYFVISYDLLCGKELTHELLYKVDEKGNEERKGRMFCDLYKELKQVLLSTDVVKRNKCLAFLGKREGFRTKVDMGEDIENII